MTFSALVERCLDDLGAGSSYEDTGGNTLSEHCAQGT
jgi:hypothetical protein